MRSGGITKRGVITLAALIAGAVFCATVFIEIANGHWTHILWLYIGGLAFVFVYGALIAILDWEGV